VIGMTEGTKTESASDITNLTSRESPEGLPTSYS
jgi:hypothetical protein